MRFEALLEAAPVFILALSPKGTIEYVNRSLNHDKRDLVGKYWLPYFPAHQHVVLQEAFESVLKTGETRTVEIMAPGMNGTPTWFSSHIGPILDGHAIVGAVLVSRDVTERKRVQAELLAARRMAALGTLAAGVAHEINTPVQFVGDSVRFLHDATNDLIALFDKLHELRERAMSGLPIEEVVKSAIAAEEQADLAFLRERVPTAFKRCLDGLQRVTDIVQSLREFATPSQRQLTLVDLNRVVENALTIAASEYRYVAELKTDFGDLPRVPCHVAEMHQVFLNVVVNAAHAIAEVVEGTDQKGLITVQTRHDGEHVVVSVTDTGTGIPEAIRPRIFDPFFTTKDVGKGVGQGLTVAYSTVTDQHGGHLTFETEIDRGTTFIVRLPLAPKGSLPTA
ncbi:MAG TPA: ATP-binding protein [Polyangiaceae bacterium]